MKEAVSEVHLLGSGGGYGESIIINLGNGDWIIIDSCINPSNNEILPLIFLEERGIEPDQIKLIVCTHWHDDHIAGISQLLGKYSDAIFSFARASDLKKFLQFVSLDYQKLNTSASNSSTNEFNKCLEILRDSKRQPKLANSDRLLYSVKEGNDSYEVWALSPSDKSSNLFDLEISKLITDFGSPHKKLPKISANDRSIVILLKLNSEVVLLGADLEVKDDKDTGWNDIIFNSHVVKASNKARYFKIPHHGSENGFHKLIWEKLLESEPVGTLTPWNRNTKLPKQEMVDKYKAVTKNLFITSPVLVSKKPKKRDRKTEKTIREFNSTIRELKFQFGVVSSKLSHQSSRDWDSALQGAAQKLK